MPADDHREDQPSAPESQTDSALPSAAVEESASPETTLEAVPAPPAATGDGGDGFWARLRMAFIGFFRGLRGLPVVVVPGEEGTIPLIEAEAAQRKVEKKLEKARATAEKLQDELKTRKDEIRERDERLKELQRELNATKSAAVKEAATVAKELEQTRQTGRNKDEQIQDLREKLGQRTGEMQQAKAEWETLGQQLKQAAREADERLVDLRKEREKLAALSQQQEATVAELRREREQQQAKLDEMTVELQRARELADQAQKSAVFQEAAFQKQIAELRDQAEEQNQQIEEVGSQLLKQMEEAGQKQDALRAEAERWQKQAQEASAAIEDTRQALDQKEKQKKTEAAKLSEETEFAQGELRALRKRVGELEGQLASRGDPQESFALQRDVKRKETQLNTLQEELSRVQVRSRKMEDALHEFYAASVNPLTIAKVSLDLIPTQALQPDDVDTLNDLKQNIAQVLEVIRGLVKKMEELEIPIERPAQPASASPPAPGKTPRKP